MIWALFIGLIVGAVAKLVMPGKDPGGIFITMLLGVAGAFVANWIGSSMGYYLPDEAPGFFASVLGAVILLALYRMLISRRTTTSS
ncbi:MAG: GlsB/YeaQ/YmgE family stress response membrane protein [Bdellovibrionaceae bacterium]|nr:GlsB/YeaQ/YmgE family stress response membrane protein [Pseudobdellovibrionaceae bacterium]MBX3033745.1 GlsB/YeaQ/YmgE family stress response membrane protein [Pseudobdellovibrionaceae bacterium]